MKCTYPDCKEPGIRRRQNTQYENDESNWAVLCEEHHKDNDEYWADMWAEYNQGRY